MRVRTFWALMTSLIWFNGSLVSQSNETTAVKAASAAHFANSPNFPSCGVGALQDGNPGNGPSTILIKLKAGCILPWHWHTSNERIIMITGSAKAEMKDASPLSMEQGDFLVMPSKHIHQFTATTDVEFYDISETTFDIHYVASSGSEISVAAALNAVNESVTK